jgi:hypothetical protein
VIAHYRQPLAWKCTRDAHTGPCALVPRFWNLWGWFWGRTKP